MDFFGEMSFKTQQKVIDAEELLKTAIVDDNLEEVKNLVKGQPSIINTIITPTKQSLLHIATALKRPEIAKYLIERGINHDLKDCNNETANDYVKQSHCEVMKHIFKDLNDECDQEVVEVILTLFSHISYIVPFKNKFLLITRL